MSIIDKMLKNGRAMYWSPVGKDRSGQIVLNDTPVEVKCRWEDTNEQFVDQTGNTVVSQARVFVDRDLEIGGFLWQGTQAEYDALSEKDPKKIRKALRIRAFGKLPNLKQKKHVRTAML